MKLQHGWWVLCLNDMRSSRIEEMEVVACASTKDELVRFIESESVETYKDDNENIRDPEPWSCHGTNKSWHKSFRKGGPLEWYNRPSDVVLDPEYDGGRAELFVWSAPDVPHVSELW